jgi:hypothetical protein
MESAVVHKKFIPICNVSLLPSNLFFVHAQVDEGKYTGKMYYLVYILFPEKKTNIFVLVLEYRHYVRSLQNLLRILNKV